MGSIRRKTYTLLKGRKNVTQAVALALFVKSRIKSSTITNFSYNKLKNLTGLHITTLKKRIDILRKLNLISFIGKNNEHLCFVCLSDRKHKKKNVNLDYLNFSSIKDIEKSLFASLLIEIQKRKEFAKHTINNAVDGHDNKLVKSSRRICRRYGFGREFVDNGISYKRIAREMGVSIKTAMLIVKYSVENGFLRKIHRQIQVYVKGIKSMLNYLEKEVDFTFCTKDNEYYIYANLYELTPLTSPNPSHGMVNIR